MHNRLARRRVLFQKAGESIADDLLHVGLHFGIHQFHLGLALKLRIGVFDADDSGHPFAGIFTAEVAVGFFEQTAFSGVIIDAAG